MKHKTYTYAHFKSRNRIMNIPFELRFVEYPPSTKLNPEKNTKLIIYKTHSCVVVLVCQK